MTDRLRVDAGLPGTAPEGVRLLGRLVAAGLPTPGGDLVVDTSDGSDVQLAARLGPLPPGAVDLVAAGAPGTVLAALPVDDVRALAGGLRTAFSLGGPVLVQPVVGSVHAGRALLRSDSRSDVVLAVEGRSHEVDAGGDVRRLAMPVLRRRQRAHRGADEWRTPLPPWAMRLSRLLRDVRQVLRVEDLDVEWADDGRVCRLLRVSRPRT